MWYQCVSSGAWLWESQSVCDPPAMPVHQSSCEAGIRYDARLEGGATMIQGDIKPDPDACCARQRQPEAS